MRLGIITGMRAEARIARVLAPQAVIALSGATEEGAVQAVKTLLKHGCDSILSFGLAAGLSPFMLAGTVVVPHRVWYDGASFEVDPRLWKLVGGDKLVVNNGDMLHVDRIIAKSAEKKALQRLHPHCVGLDMESGVVAGLCHYRHIPFAVLRIICDDVNHSLPPLVETTLSHQGRIQLGKVLLSLLCYPWQLFSVGRIALCSLKVEHIFTSYVKNNTIHNNSL